MSSHGSDFGTPRRIVCLTEETTETLYALGAGDRIVGVSGFTVRPPEARREKAIVSTYLEADLEEITGLDPDLILAWSDLQAPVAAELIRAGFEVWTFNQRSVAGILEMIARLGRVVGAAERAVELVDLLRRRLDQVAAAGARRDPAPAVYFEEWYDPLISGIGWVSELVELAGGRDVFAELAGRPDAKGRIIADPDDVVRRAPDVLLASWCGKKFKPERVRARAGWHEVPAVRDGHLHGIPSAEILQPGPAALTDGLDAIVAALDGWQRDRPMG